VVIGIELVRSRGLRSVPERRGFGAAKNATRGQIDGLAPPKKRNSGDKSTAQRPQKKAPLRGQIEAPQARSSVPTRTGFTPDTAGWPKAPPSGTNAVVIGTELVRSRGLRSVPERRGSGVPKNATRGQIDGLAPPKKAQLRGQIEAPQARSSVPTRTRFTPGTAGGPKAPASGTNVVVIGTELVRSRCPRSVHRLSASPRCYVVHLHAVSNTGP